ncbi:MAG: carbohydrate ABC transporter permease [Clostridia bacterium]|nr:carbohydrate ABC transporter permease [Clostridia bacterium]
MTNADTRASEPRRRASPGGIALGALSALVAFIFLLPVLWMVSVSFKVEGSLIRSAFSWFAPPYSTDAYAYIFKQSKMLRWVWNSLFVAVTVTALVVLLSSMASFALAKLPFRYKNAMYIFFLLGLMVPGEATIVPLFVTANRLNILDTYQGLILPALAGSMNIIIMRSFFRGIPNDLIESATIDGAGELYVYTRIILPLGRTVMVTIAIFTFIGNWNSFLWPYLCAMGEDMFTLPLGIPQFINQYTQDKVRPMAINTVASIPIIIFFIVFERQIVKGIALSGIKG